MNFSKRFSFLGKYIFLLLLIIVAILPRVTFIDKVPNAINQDELHYALDAKSFFLSGKDVLGQTSLVDVLFFKSPKSEPMQAELQYFLGIPLFAMMGFSMTSLALPNVLLGILTVVLIYLITLKLFDKNTAIFTGLIAALNPWLIFLSRTTYEAGPATLFFLLVFYALLITKGWKILWTIPLALLAFYSYIGTKLIFVPFMLTGILYAFIVVNKKKYLKQYVVLFSFSCFLMLFFLFQIGQHSNSSRDSEILLPNSPAIIKRVNDFRKVTLQNPFMEIVENKFTDYGAVITNNVFNVFSPTYLFANADYFFMAGGHGLFYYIDSIFLVIGLITLFLYRKKIFLLFAVIISFAVLPQLFHASSVLGNFTPHIALVIPFFIIAIGFGFNSAINLLRQKKLKYLMAICVVVLYVGAFINFSYFYFLKFPLQEATFEVQNRILSKYLSLYGGRIPITVFSGYPKLAFREYVFYTNSFGKNNLNQISNSLRTNQFTFSNISFVPCDDPRIKDLSTLSIVDISCTEKIDRKSINIVQLKDSGIRYSIYSDKICSKYNLPNYVSGLKLSDLNIENLGEKKFCETFLVSFL